MPRNPYAHARSVARVQLERLPPAALVVLALLAGLTCQLLLGTSYVAASLDPLREEAGVPVAVVLLDEGPHGASLLARLQARASPVLWERVGSREAAMEGLADKAHFGALVIPANFTADLDSFASDRPRSAFVETFASPGASTSGSLIAARALELAVDATRDVARERALASATIGTTGLGALTLDQGRYLADPVVVRHVEVNAVPAGGANGLAPTYLAMAAWIGGYLGAIALERFRPQTGLPTLARAGIVVGAALVQGALAVGAAAAIGLAIPDVAEVVLLVAIGTWMAYALVGLLTDLLGLAGVLPAFAVLALGLPAAGAIYPAGLLPDLFQALHSVSPFTWLVEGLRTTLYARGADDLGGHMLALAGLALACTAASLAWQGFIASRPSRTP